MDSRASDATAARCAYVLTSCACVTPNRQLAYTREVTAAVFRTREGRIMLALHTPNTHLEERPIFIPLTEKDGLLQPEANGSAALC